MYSRAIIQWPAVRNPKVAQMQAVCCMVAGLGAFPHWMHDFKYSLNIIVIYPYFSHTFSKILRRRRIFETLEVGTQWGITSVM